jgi:hypothetical protein
VWRAGWRGRAVAVTMLLELGYAIYLQACFVTSIAQILLGRKAGWNYVPRAAAPALVAPWLPAALVAAWGIALPASVLQTGWYAALALWVGFNTLIFAFLSILHLLPPLHRLRRRTPVTSVPAAELASQ